MHFGEKTSENGLFDLFNDNCVQKDENKDLNRSVQGIFALNSAAFSLLCGKAHFAFF